MRVLLRGDLDGIVCTVIMKEVLQVEEILQLHPKDMQDGKVDVRETDIICNLPYHPNCAMWFDHHASEYETAENIVHVDGAFGESPSTARLVYNYYLKDNPQLKRLEEILDATDKIDSASLTKDEVLNPKGGVLLGFILDPRTSFGFHRNFTISNKQMTDMMPELMMTKTVDEILALPDVQERVKLYFEAEEEAKAFFSKHSRLDENVIITDVRGIDKVPAGNRFLIYTLPKLEKGNVSIRIADGKKNEFSTIQAGYNIFNRDSEIEGCKTDLGALMAQYGGGGHEGAATCQPSLDMAETVLQEIIATLKKNG